MIHNDFTGIVVYTFECTDLSNENLYTRNCVNKSIQGESCIDYCREYNDNKLKLILDAHSELQSRNELWKHFNSL